MNRCPLMFPQQACTNRCYSTKILLDRCSWGTLRVRASAVPTTPALHTKQSTKENFPPGILDQFVEVGFLSWEAASADQLDQSIVVDEDIAGVNISDLAVILLELRSGSDHGVEQIPQLSFEEVPVDLPPVLDLHLEDVGIVVEG